MAARTCVRQLAGSAVRVVLNAHHNLSACRLAQTLSPLVYSTSRARCLSTAIGQEERELNLFLEGIAEEEGAADAVDKKPKFIRQQTPPRVLDRSPFMKRCVKDVRTYAKQGKFTRVLALTYEAASQPQLTPAERLDLFSITAPLLSREKRYEDTMALVAAAQQAGLPLSGSLVAAGMAVALKTGHIRKALDLFAAARATPQLQIMEHTTPVCLAVEALVKQGDWTAAAELLQEMRRFLNTAAEGGVVYDAALQACSDSGPREFVYKWLDEIIIAEKLKGGARVPRSPVREAEADAQ